MVDKIYNTFYMNIVGSVMIFDGLVSLANKCPTGPSNLIRYQLSWLKGYRDPQLHMNQVMS